LTGAFGHRFPAFPCFSLAAGKTGSPATLKSGAKGLRIKRLCGDVDRGREERAGNLNSLRKGVAGNFDSFDASDERLRPPRRTPGRLGLLVDLDLDWLRAFRSA
jgi:hypothetical protein